MKSIKLAVIGATGLVGRTVLKVLEEDNINISEYHFFASAKSAGKEIIFKNKKYIIEELNEKIFEKYKFNYAIFCAGSEISLKYIPIAVKNNCISIDNSSAYRMYPNVPLVIPEVNPDALINHNNIISNPNCSTIQALVALKPLHDKYNIKRIMYTTYQAVSGAGYMGCEDLKNEYLGIKNKKFIHPIYNNCIPQIDDFLENHYTKEEMKMINETHKILANNDIKITATTVRVPVYNCHSESINIEFKKDFNIIKLKKLLKNSKGIILQDDIYSSLYPLAINCVNRNEVFVGRIRRDFSVKSGINIWVVADNLRKGAATNAVQILKLLVLT